MKYLRQGMIVRLICLILIYNNLNDWQIVSCLHEVSRNTLYATIILVAPSIVLNKLIVCLNSLSAIVNYVWKIQSYKLTLHLIKQ